MKNDFITFRESDHTYWGADGRQYTSVSKLISRFTPEFDAELMSHFTAKKRDKVSKEMAVKLGISQLDVLLTYPLGQRGITKEEVLKEWDNTRDSASGRGHAIHKGLEIFSQTGRIISEATQFESVIRSVDTLFKEYKQVWNEAVFHSIKYCIAGTADKPCGRTSVWPCTLDISDFKTNESRGIQYFSKYGKYLLGPLSHLEDCNFNKYAMQLSVYALMAQEQYNCKVGKLRLIYIPPGDNKYEIIPVPYMKLEAEVMMEANLAKFVPVNIPEVLKKLPITHDQAFPIKGFEMPNFE